MYVTRCLRRRTGPAVLQAAKEILLQLRQTGLHVANLHTELGSTMKNSGIQEQLEAGGDPTANSTAELGVKWAKARVRSLLRSTKAAGLWRWIMRRAVCGPRLSPQVRGPILQLWRSELKFGFEPKATKGRRKKLRPRWYQVEDGARDVSRGHLILREDGGLAIANGVKFNIVEPHALEPDAASRRATGAPQHNKMPGNIICHSAARDALRAAQAAQTAPLL